MAYVVVQHLDPTHESLLPHLLAQATRMEVSEAREERKVSANQVYIIAPNTDMAISHGVLHLLSRTERAGQHLSIDTFEQIAAKYLECIKDGVY